MANAYIDALRKLSDRLAIGEAQQRRVFFEEQLKRAQAGLLTAQQALQKSGFTQEALRSEPKAAADHYAKLQASVMAAQIKLDVMRHGLLDTTPEVQAQRTLVDGLREQLSQAELPLADNKNDEYVSKYRDVKYQETLTVMLARQYETARVDEAREGALVQVVDRAVPAEKKSKPKRVAIAILAAIAAFGVLTVWLSARRVWLRANQRRAGAGSLQA
jgi:capsule polysaccharide export protein KpsE/RkpR